MLENECVLVRWNDILGFKFKSAYTPVTFKFVSSIAEMDVLRFRLGRGLGQKTSMSFQSLKFPWWFAMQAKIKEGVNSC